jgi:rare lipoprotein A
LEINYFLGTVTISKEPVNVLPLKVYYRYIIPKIEVSLYKILAVLITIFFLGACAQTQLLVHTAKRIGQPDKKQQGRYKIGTPYQIKGKWYYPAVDYSYNKTGIASWYGPGFDGKMTANGEIYDQNALTAAHKTLPMPSIVQVTNLENGRSIKVTINDRGPYAFSRIIDMSRRGAQLLGFHRKGTAKVHVEILADESRMLAHSVRNRATLAKFGTPIRRNLNVAKPPVVTGSLGPPSAINPSGKILKYKPKKVMNRKVSDKRLSHSHAEKIINRPVSVTNIYVQAGAFTRFDYANQTAAKLSELGNISVSSFVIKGKEFFRVRTGPIDAINNADEILERVIRAGFNNARIVVD